MHPAHWYVSTVSWNLPAVKSRCSKQGGAPFGYTETSFVTLKLENTILTLCVELHHNCNLDTKLAGKKLWNRQAHRAAPPWPSPGVCHNGQMKGVKGLPSLLVTLLGHLCKQGFRGFKGEKGEPGQPGLDGLDAPCQLVQYFSLS